MTTPEQVMQDAGWFIGRRVDVTEDQAALVKGGYMLSDSAEAVLREVSGLIFRTTRHGRPDTIWFDARKAMSRTTPESVRAYEQRLEGRLTPIGYAYHEHLLLLVTNAGRLIGTYDDYVADLGSAPQEAIRRLLTQDIPHT